MYTAKTVDNYVNHHPSWKGELEILRALLLETELEECIKWGAPCYTYKGENIIGMMGFNNYAGIWFHQGVFLKDKANVLVNAQEGKTKALRQWRFTSKDDIKVDLVRSYIDEAIQNARNGRKVNPTRTQPLIIPAELELALSENKPVHEKFDVLKPGQKREFANYISEAKRADTKLRRIEKIIPMICAGVGLNDKYK